MKVNQLLALDNESAGFKAAQEITGFAKDSGEYSYRHYLRSKQIEYTDEEHLKRSGLQTLGQSLCAAAGAIQALNGREFFKDIEFGDFYNAVLKKAGEDVQKITVTDAVVPVVSPTVTIPQDNPWESHEPINISFPGVIEQRYYNQAIMDMLPQGHEETSAKRLVENRKTSVSSTVDAFKKLKPKCELKNHPINDLNSYAKNRVRDVQGRIEEINSEVRRHMSHQRDAEERADNLRESLKKTSAAPFFSSIKDNFSCVDGKFIFLGFQGSFYWFLTEPIICAHDLNNQFINFGSFVIGISTDFNQRPCINTLAYQYQEYSRNQYCYGNSYLNHGDLLESTTGNIMYGSHPHPHTYWNGDVCWGSFKGKMNDAVNLRDIEAQLLLCHHLLTHYNSGSPYVDFHDFKSQLDHNGRTGYQAYDPSDSPGESDGEDEEDY